MSENLETLAGAITTRRQANLAIAGSGTVALLLGLYMYGPTLQNWAGTFNSDPTYSHGWALPFISGYFAYRILSNPAGKELRARSAPDGLGLLILVLGCALFLFAQRTTIIFLAELSFLVVLAGAITALFGRAIMRSLAFPYGILYFGLPLPALLYMPVSFRLQLISTVLAERLLDLLQIPSLREGNIIALPGVRLEVVQACSGIHSLFALLAVACVVGYVTVPNNFGRTIVTLIAIPVAILLNAARVTLMGITCYLIDPAYAEGFAHFSVGMVVFGIGCLIILFLADRLSAVFPHRHAEAARAPEALPRPSTSSGFSTRMLLPAVVLGATLLLNLLAAGSVEAMPLQRSWSYFPLQLGEWSGRDLSMTDTEVRTLGTHDLLLREYHKGTNAVPVGLYIAYFPQQRTGTGMHSPLHCIPGAGWQVSRESSALITTSPFREPIRVNQIIFQRQDKKELVLYWYLEQGAVEDGELRGALLTLWNGIRYGRTDGCLIRISSPIQTTETAALKLQEQFIQAAFPVAMADFLPGHPDSLNAGPRNLVSSEVHR